MSPSRRLPWGARASAALLILACSLLLLTAPAGPGPDTARASSPLVGERAWAASAAPRPTPENPTPAADLVSPESLDRLERRVRELIEACPGEPAVVVMPRDASWSITHQAEATTAAASLIKLPILLALEALEGRGELVMDNRVDLESEDRTGGSGRLKAFRSGTSLTFRELAERMVVESDNTATNAIIRVVGRDTIQAEFEALGLRATRLDRRILERGDNPTTAQEMAQLLAVVEGPEAGNLLERVENRRRLARWLPPHARIAHKTGTLRRHVHDAGIVETPSGPLIVVGLVSGARSWPEAEAWLGELGRVVYEAGGGTPAGRGRSSRGIVR